MTKAPAAFRSIGEVARIVGVAPHVLRYWEEQFTQLSPIKRADGRRYYRPQDVYLAAGIFLLLREDGLTIRGARRVLAKDRGAEARQRGERSLSAGGRLTETDSPSEAPADTTRHQAKKTTRRPSSPKAPGYGADAPTALNDISDWLARLSRIATNLRRLDGLPDPAQRAAMAVIQQAGRKI